MYDPKPKFLTTDHLLLMLKEYQMKVERIDEKWSSPQIWVLILHTL